MDIKQWFIQIFTSSSKDAKLDAVSSKLSGFARKLETSDLSKLDFNELTSEIAKCNDTLVKLERQEHGWLGRIKNRTRQQRICSEISVIQNLQNKTVRLLAGEADQLESKYKQLSIRDINKQNTSSLLETHEKLAKMINEAAVLTHRIEQQNNLLATRESPLTISSINLLQKISAAVKGIQLGSQAMEEQVEQLQSQFIRESKLQMANEDPLYDLNQLPIAHPQLSFSFTTLTALAKPELVSDVTQYVEKILHLHSTLTTYTEQHSFSSDDYKKIGKCIEELKIACDKNPALNEALTPLIDILENGQSNILQSYHEIQRALKKLPLGDLSLISDSSNGIKSVYAVLQSNHPELSEQQLKTLKVASDIYWIFNSPFATKITIENFIVIALDADENELSQEFRTQLSDDVMLELGNLEPSETFIREVALGKSNDQLPAAARRELRDHKLMRLLELSKENRTELEKLDRSIPNVVIAGGGPGGLIRGLIAAISGVNWEVIEMRDRSSSTWVQAARKNVLKLGSMDVYKMLSYFGVYDELVLKGETNTFDEYTWGASIGSLENAMTTVLKNFENAHGKISAGEVKGVRTGQNEANRQVSTEVIVKRTEEMGSSVPADIIVASDGAGGVTSEALGIHRQALSETTMMLAIRIDNPQETPPVDGIKTMRGMLDLKEGLFEFDIPNAKYMLVHVTPDLVNEIREKKEAISALKDTELKKEKEQEFNQWLHESAKAFMLTTGYTGEVVLSRIFEIKISKGHSAAVLQGHALGLSSGDAYATPDPMAGVGCKVAIRSSRLFSYLLQSQFRSKSRDPYIMRAEYNFAMNRVYGSFVTHSFKSRRDYAPATETPAYLLQQAEENGSLDHEFAEGLRMVFAKHALAAPLTDEDYAMWQEGQAKVELAARTPGTDAWAPKLYSKMQAVAETTQTLNDHKVSVLKRSE